MSVDLKVSQEDGILIKKKWTNIYLENVIYVFFNIRQLCVQNSIFFCSEVQSDHIYLKKKTVYVGGHI